MTTNLIKGIPFYLNLFKRYLGNSIYFAIILTIFASILDGFGIAVIVPFFETLNKDVSQVKLTGMSAVVQDFLSFLNLPTNSYIILILLGIIFVLKGFFSFSSQSTIAYLNGKLLQKLKMKLITLYSKVNYMHYAKQDTGHFVNITNEQPFFALISFFNLNIVISKIITTLTYLVLLLFISWQFGLLTFLVAIISLSCFKYINNVVRKLSRKNVIEKSKLSNLIVQTLQSFKYLLATGQNKLLSIFIKNSIKKITKYEIKANIAYSFSASLKEPISVVGVIIMLFIQLTFFKQSFSSFLVSILVIYRAYSAVFTIQTGWQKVLQHIGSLELIDNEIKLISRNQDISGKISCKSFNESIEFNNVSFSYGDGLKTINKVNLIIPSKNTIAFVGESGAGKTTIIDLISLILKPESGSIYIDNVPSEDINVDDWRNQIGYISQDNVMFDDNIANNICLWSGDINDSSFMKKIEIAAKQASLDKFVASLPNGYKTHIGDRGVRLSGGQRQRVCIARELFRKPKLLILDEATSALDSNMEALVKKSIDKLRGKITILIIAHRLSTIENTDKIFVLDQGKLIEEGNYIKLSRNKKSKFYQLLSKQLESDINYDS
tara:strand:- start:277 stop:2097 length:1821 start_codon:yes stop_codon:yes gene_type:complete